MTREAMPYGDAPCVYVIHENDAWLQPLRGEFEARGIQIIASNRDAFRAALAPLYARYEDIWGRGVFAHLQAL
jgi:hypothetical protein